MSIDCLQLENLFKCFVLFFLDLYSAEWETGETTNCPPRGALQNQGETLYTIRQLDNTGSSKSLGIKIFMVQELFSFSRICKYVDNCFTNTTFCHVIHFDRFTFDFRGVDSITKFMKIGAQQIMIKPQSLCVMWTILFMAGVPMSNSCVDNSRLSVMNST